MYNFEHYVNKGSWTYQTEKICCGGKKVISYLCNENVILRMKVFINSNRFEVYSFNTGTVHITGSADRMEEIISGYDLQSL